MVMVDATSRRSGLVLTIDELQLAARPELAELAATLQQHVPDGWPLVVALAGLPTIRDGHRSVTYLERSEWHELGMLSHADAVRALVGPAADAGRPLRPAAADLLAAASGGYPYAVQVLGHHAWRASSGERAITERHARAALPRAEADLATALYAGRWADVSAKEREYLAAVAATMGDDDTTTGSQVAAHLGVTAKEVSYLRDRLIKKGTVVAVRPYPAAPGARDGALDPPTPGGGRAVIVVTKIGTSSITSSEGQIDDAAIAKFCAEAAALRELGHRVVLVTSGAIAAGLPGLGYTDGRRPRDAVTLQAASAVGQTRLMRVYEQALASHGLVSGQVLLAPLDFTIRQQYLHARATLGRLLDLGVVPVVNENDAIADDEIRFGDNDRLAALVAHLLAADLLVLLTDAPGLLTADPRLDSSASLIEEIVEVDHSLESLAGGSGSTRGSGGMASKLAAAKIAAWSGVRAVIAQASRDGVLEAAVGGAPGAGTVIHPKARRLPARKLWIAFAVGANGTVVVDDGARRALLDRGVSLLPAGVSTVQGSFEVDDAVEIAGLDGTVFAKGLVRLSSVGLREVAGRRTADLPEGVPHEVVHRDDLVVLP